MSNETPIVQPVTVEEFTSKRSKYKMVGTLPASAGMIGPSGSGETMLLQSLLSNIYAGSIERLFNFSHSIVVNYSWAPVEDFVTIKKNGR